MAKGAVAKRRKPSKPPAPKGKDGVVFKDMEVTLCAPDGGPLRQRIDAHEKAIAEAAERGVVGPYERGEPPTVDKAAEKSEAVYAFADRLGVGSKTFQFHFSQLISEKPSAGFVQAAIDAMEPKDPFEAMLSAQMATVHAAMMEMSGRLGRVEYLPQMREYEGAMNRLARTYTAQMEALRKHRSGGKQTVMVQHVNVGDGGKAIVGEVRHGGGVKMNDDANPMRKAHSAPRCTAKSKRSGLRCKGPAVRGWTVCRMHGAGGGHGPGTANPAFKHGMRGREWAVMRSEISELIRFAP